VFGIAGQAVQYSTHNPGNDTPPPAKFMEMVAENLDEMATRVAAGGGGYGSGKKFATQEANFTAFERIVYCLGQCTPD